MSTLLDVADQGEWVVSDAAPKKSLYPPGTLLNFEAQTMTPDTKGATPSKYGAVAKGGGPGNINVVIGTLSFMLKADGNGFVSDSSDTAGTTQPLKKVPIPTTPPGGEGSDITGLVVFLALIIGFVVFLK